MTLTAELCTNENGSSDQRARDLISRQDFLPGFQIRNCIIRSAKAARGACLGHCRDERENKRDSGKPGSKEPTGKQFLLFNHSILKKCTSEIVVVFFRV